MADDRDGGHPARFVGTNRLLKPKSVSVALAQAVILLRAIRSALYHV
jgi:hypothetical protein